MIENTNFWQGYTAMEVLEGLAAIKKEIGKEEVRESIIRVGLDPDNKKTVDKYSLGMRQRLSIAQAIMEKTDIILLDEPTNALDKSGVQQMYDILEEEKNRGALIVVASHNENDIMKCNEMITMSRGRIECIEELLA